MRTWILALVCAIELATAALAQTTGNLGAGSGPRYGSPGPGGPAGPPPNAMPNTMPNTMFDAIDTDHDGAITMRELRKAVVALKQLDADKDGKITRDEVMGGPPNPQAMIEHAMENDKDGDGKLSKSELPRHLAQLLSTADTNGDGALDRAELANVIQGTQPQFGGPGFGNGGGAQQGFRGAGGFGADPRPTANLSQFDRNGDGQLSADEMPNNLRGMLRGTDQNGDGKLDSQELQAIQQRVNERARGQRALPPGVSIGPQGVTGKPQQR
ncbi:MAG: EF-hand domain-containing protein [Pirellulales bacterium]